MFVETSDGLVGVGEATLEGHEAEVLARLHAVKPRFVGQPSGDIQRLCGPLPPPLPLRGSFGGLVHAAVISAIEQALWDILGQQLGVPVYKLLGGACHEAIRLYANINRSTLSDRSASAFARNAASAVAAGFTAIKCAPFDGIVRSSIEDTIGRRLISEGLARLRAIRDAVGFEIDVLVDCHSRFDDRTATIVLSELSEFRPYWVEAPVSESDLGSWARVRAGTRARIAGGEFLIGLRAHREFLAATGVDVVMTDVKFAGGIGMLKKVGGLAEAYGVRIAPHNPSGPVGTLASLHAAITLPNTLILEYAWGEVDWRADLVGGAERIEDGYLKLPDGPGLGITIDANLVRTHPAVQVPVAPDLWRV